MTDLNAIIGQYAGILPVLGGIYRKTLPAGKSVSAHTADRPTHSAGFVFPVRGNAVFTFDGTGYELAPGIVVHGGPGMELTMEAGAELDYYLVHYRAAALPGQALAGPVRNDCTNSHFALEPGENQKLVELLRLLHAAFATPGPVSRLRTRQLFDSLLYELLACSRDRLYSSSGEAVGQALDYIAGHYMEPLNLQDLADRCGMSVKSFSYQFHKYVGMFPIDYLIQYRMKKAEELLATSDFPIRQIASCVGYDDALYFSRLFKKHSGRSPSRFRLG